MIKWSLAAENFIIENAGNMKDEEMASELAKILGVKLAVATLRKKRQRMGLRKSGGRGITKLYAVKPLRDDAEKNIGDVSKLD